MSKFRPKNVQQFDLHSPVLHHQQDENVLNGNNGAVLQAVVNLADEFAGNDGAVPEVEIAE